MDVIQDRGQWRTLVDTVMNLWVLYDHTRVYPKVSRLAAWSENFKWYSSSPLGAVASLFCESD